MIGGCTGSKAQRLACSSTWRFYRIPKKKKKTPPFKKAKAKKKKAK